MVLFVTLDEVVLILCLKMQCLRVHFPVKASEQYFLELDRGVYYAAKGGCNFETEDEILKCADRHSNWPDLLVGLYLLL